MTSQRSRSGDDGSSSFDPPISPALLRKLNLACGRLFNVQPWTFVGEDQKLGMDIPDLGLAGAVLTITGDAGRYRGILVFPSAVGYERHLRAIAEAGYMPFGTTSFGTEVLALTFQTVTELPAPLRREALKRGLVPIELTAEYLDQCRMRILAKNSRVVPVYYAGSLTLFAQDPPGLVYPSIANFDDEGRRVPLTAHDIEVVNACAAALGVFLSTHRACFRADDPVTVRRTYRSAIGREVRFTVPYNALLGESTDPSADT